MSLAQTTQLMAGLLGDTFYLAIDDVVRNAFAKGAISNFSDCEFRHYEGEPMKVEFWVKGVFWGRVEQTYSDGKFIVNKTIRK